MATNRSLDSLIEAANMIEKSIGDKDNSSGGESSNFGAECEYSRSLSSRMNHNVLERNRRAQMRQNFNSLQKILPKLTGQKKVSNVCILKAATNEIKAVRIDGIDWEKFPKVWKKVLRRCEESLVEKQKEKLLDEDITYRNEIEKLQESNMRLITKLRMLQSPLRARGIDQKGDRTGTSGINITDCMYESTKSSGNSKEIGRSEIGVNTDFAQDSDDYFLQDSDDLQIEIED